MVPLKRVVEINARILPEDTPRDFSFRYIDISSVGHGRLVAEPIWIDFAHAPSRARRIVSMGDTLISTVRTYLKAVLPVDEDGFVASTGFACLTPGVDTDARYLAWWAQSDQCIDEISARSTGVSYPAINPTDLATLPFPLRNICEQRAIADLLDAEVARIDALIAKKRRVLQLAHMRFRAQVDELTGCGRVVRVRRVAESITSGPRGWSDQVGEVGLPFIRSANLRRDDIVLRSDNLMCVDVPLTAEAARSQVRKGDTLVGITGANTGWVGLVDRIHAGGFISQHVARIRPRGVMPEWLAFSVFAQRSQESLLGGQYGGTKQQLGLEDLAELTIQVPSVEKQKELVQSLQRAARLKIELIEKLDRQIDLLKERRRALITAAIKGELDKSGVSR